MRFTFRLSRRAEIPAHIELDHRPASVDALAAAAVVCSGTGAFATFTPKDTDTTGSWIDLEFVLAHDADGAAFIKAWNVELAVRGLSAELVDSGPA